MLTATEYSPECQSRWCKYNLESRCGLNLKDGPIITEQCSPTDSWYIVGSFVLDRIFEKTTANDIDLVALRGEMPADLPDEVLSSPLPIEMLWKEEKTERSFECYNISLPRIASAGLLNWHIVDSLRSDRTICVLPGVRKVSILSIYAAIKPMVKYDMQPDNRTFRIWLRSIQDPLGWKRGFRWLAQLLDRRIEYVNWDYCRAEHLTFWLDRAYRELTDAQRKQYLHCLKRILEKMPLAADRAYQYLLQWIDASIENDDQKKKQIQDSIGTQRFKWR